jgi:hypothetical protein
MSNQITISRTDRKPVQREPESQYAMPGRRSHGLPAPPSSLPRRPLTCGELDLLF